jgi:hypothetical protein
VYCAAAKPKLSSSYTQETFLDGNRFKGSSSPALGSVQSPFHNGFSTKLQYHTAEKEKQTADLDDWEVKKFQATQQTDKDEKKSSTIYISTDATGQQLHHLADKTVRSSNFGTNNLAKSLT